jgi:hypothetical protein
MKLIDLSEMGLIPDVLIRAGIRRLLRQRLRQLHQAGSIAEFARSLCDQPLAVATEQANEQHYEVPTEFFERVLGPRLKYSACYFPAPETTLGEAELQRWRIFFMACAELFRYRNGAEWFVCHYRFRQARVAPPRGARWQLTGSFKP